MNYHAYHAYKLADMNISKGELITMMGIEKWDGAYDTALPQGWLDDFVSRTKLPYNLVLSTTVWFYSPKHAFGFPVSGCIEVSDKLSITMPIPNAVRINEID